MKAAALERALALTRALAQAAAAADWEQVARLAGARLELLHALYENPLADPHTLVELGQEILAADRAVAEQVSAARAELAARLRALRAGRRATRAYAASTHAEALAVAP